MNFVIVGLRAVGQAVGIGAMCAAGVITYKGTIKGYEKLRAKFGRSKIHTADIRSM